MYIEAQFSTEIIKNIARLFFGQDGVTITKEFDYNGEPYVVDHVEVIGETVIKPNEGGIDMGRRMTRRVRFHDGGLVISCYICGEPAEVRPVYDGQGRIIKHRARCANDPGHDCDGDLQISMQLQRCGGANYENP